MNAYPKITTCLWFDHQAEEAVNFYTEIFKNSKVLSKSFYGETGIDIHGFKAGSVMSIDFELNGQNFQALNGGPYFTFNQTVSLYVKCTSEAQIDDLWSNLSDGGEILMELMEYPFSKKYGWLSDKYGLSWQFILINGEPSQSILPCLMFVNNQQNKAEKAIHFYMRIFDDSELLMNAHYEDGQTETEATVVHAEFKICGSEFVVMDSGVIIPIDINFNEAISFIISCSTQEEINYYWEELSADPASEQCGWLKDKYGVSWQVIPNVLEELLSGPSTKKKQRMMEALLKMKKLDIGKLLKAYEGS